MNKQQLKEELEGAGVMESAYSMDGGGSGEAYVLSDDGDGMWSTYYSERGLNSSRRKFSSEEQACRHFMNWILQDRSVRKRE